MDMASTIEGLCNLAKDDPYTSIDGRKMLVAVRQRLGPLKHGEVYALPLDLEDEARWLPEQAELTDLVGYLMAFSAITPFEVIRAPYKPADLQDELEA
jgi:hypothetical protein